MSVEFIEVKGANEHNLKDLSLRIKRGSLTVVTGVSGSGKSSLAFDTVLAESQRRFFYTLSHYSRQFLDLGQRPNVRFVSGLSPSISLAQNETAPSRRATLGSLTDLSELLAVMFARFGDQHCPKHNKVTSALSPDEIIQSILRTSNGKTIALVVPLAESKKGVFKAQLTKFANAGFQRAWIDGDLMELDPIPELEREEKHTIKILIDVLKIKNDQNAKSIERLQRSLDTTLSQGQGFGEWFIVDEKFSRQGDIHSVSSKGGCPDCGFSWPKLDSRYFNPNSLGRCLECNGYGVLNQDDYLESHEDVEAADSWEDVVCEACEGTGIQRDSMSIRVLDQSIHSLLKCNLTELNKALDNIHAQGRYASNPAFERVYGEIVSGLKQLLDMNLSYLSLSRRVRTLSGGESQRVKLAGVLSSGLRGILYVLDEPSQGLHHTELSAVVSSLRKLCDAGNTVIVVDHDETVMKSADWILDLGPGGGRNGGHLVAQFNPSKAREYASTSKTASWLTRQKLLRLTHFDRGGAAKFFEITQPRLNNLKANKVRFGLQAMNVVTGVSGAGKSSLVLGCVLQNMIKAIADEVTEKRAKYAAIKKPAKQPAKAPKKSSKTQPKEIEKSPWMHCSQLKGYEAFKTVHLIDRKPVAKSSVSMPATYLDILGELRDLYASLPDSQIFGLTAKSFSLHGEGGRCEECKGKGELNLQMRFLSDARVICSTCEGKRFKPHILDVTFNSLSIHDVLNLTIDEAIDHFKNHKRIITKLLPAQRLGLGYLKMGQPSSSLSGGESQRLKMVPYFSKKMGEHSLLILDEPTTGLHFEDVERLILMMRELVDIGATLIVVEHSEEVRLASDWEVRLGPGSAHEGGLLVYEGSPKQSS
jgi:excinuclease ABC subunit A